MLLAIDIGNTNAVVGMYDGANLRQQVRLASRANMTADEAGFFITSVLERMKVANEAIDRVVIGSVVPALTSTFETTSKRFFGCTPLVVSAAINLPIKIDIEQPGQVGADRIANAVAGFARFGGPIIIVDFGTATTFDIVDERGAYIGGVIIPGPETSMAELAKRAARLFEIRIERPDHVVGKSTAEALKSGLFYGTIGQVDFILEKILTETGFEKPMIIATGGLSSGIEQHSRYIAATDAALTLEGLRLIAEHNRE